MQVPELSIIIPVYNEEDNLAELHARLVKVMLGLNKSYEIIFIDDSSMDRSFEILKELHANDHHVQVIRFTRNFGQHPAVTAGFRRATGAVMITLDADLQNPPEEIPKLLAKLDEGYDVAAGWRENRHDPIFRRMASAVVNRMIARMTGVKLRDYGCMFRAYRANVIRQLDECQELNRFITALVSWLGVSIGEVKLKHAPREGHSKYSFRKLLRMNFDLITGFSIFPIQAMSLIGFLLALGGLVLGALLGFWRLAYGSGPGGLVTFLAVIFILFGVQLFALGLIGEYVGRIFIETQRRSYYLIKDVIEEE